LIFNAQTGLAFAYFFAGRNEDALSCATTALRQQPKFVGAHLVMMACHAGSGQLKEAREARARALQLNPTLRISETATGPYREKLAQAYRIAGMPE